MKGKNNRMIRRICLILMVMAAAAAGILYYMKHMERSLREQSVSWIREVTAQGNRAFGLYAEKDLQLLDRIVRHLALELPDNQKAIREIIASFRDKDISFAVADLERGVMYAGETPGGREMDGEELALFGAFGAEGVMEPYINRYTGLETIGGYQRFDFANGSQGMVLLRRPLATVAEEFMLSFYNEGGFTYAANSQGDILVRPNSSKNKHTFSNILEAAESSGNSQEEVAAFRDDMAQGQEGVMRLAFDGEETMLAYTPFYGIDGWYFITLVPDDVIMKHNNDILKNAQIFVLFLGAMLVVVCLFTSVEWKLHRTIIRQDHDAQYREQMFGILANNTNDVYLMIRTEGAVVEYISPNAERVLGIPREELKADIRVLERAFLDSAGVFGWGGIRDSLALDECVTREGEQIHRESGERRWFVETVYRKTINQSERLLIVLSDRTNERRREEALKDALEIAKVANESKSLFLNSMSHDIRTPMNAIVGLSTLLQRDADNPDKVREHTQKITSSSQHLLGLINDVLDISKIESGKVSLNISEISLAEVVEELDTMIQPQAKAKGQEFRITVQDICNEEVLGDRLRLDQILINILSNAVKYTQAGGRIEMAVRQLPQATKHYARFHFVVKDNGIGMSSEYLENIFQPFTRETTRKTLGIQGTGLGMAITKNLVDLMGGAIEVESELNRGSTFTVSLELRIQEQEADPAFWAQHGIASLLVVDDDEDVCLGVKNAMAETGVQVQCALGGQEAIALAKSAGAEGRGFDLALIDWQMPDISGIETARQMREIVPANVPLVVLTAYDISSIQEEGLGAGIDGFLQKPFFLSNFRLLISALKEGAKTETEEPGSQETALAGRHVLAAEDIELNAEILTEMLKMIGVTCDWAANGQEAFERFALSEPGRYDAILMDVQMPVMDGYEATRAIRGCGHPQSGVIPIIAMTANAFSEDVKEALSSGMNRHLAKPVNMEELQAALLEMLLGPR